MSEEQKLTISFSNCSIFGVTKMLIEGLYCSEDNVLNNVNCVFCGGLFPIVLSKEELDSNHRVIKTLRKLKENNPDSFTIILSPRDIYILSFIQIFGYKRKSLDGKLARLRTLMQKGITTDGNEEVEINSLEEIIYSLNKESKSLLSSIKKYMLKIVKKENVEDNNELIDEFIKTTIIIEMGYESITFNKFFPRLLLDEKEPISREHIFMFLDFYRPKKDTLTYMLENSVIRLEDNKNIFCSLSTVSCVTEDVNPEYKKAILKLRSKKIITKFLLEYIESKSGVVFPSGKTFIVGDSISECDTPIEVETDKADIVYLNTEIGRYPNTIFYYSSTIGISVGYKIQSVVDQECFGILKINDNSFGVEGINAAGMIYNVILSKDTYMHKTINYPIEGDEFLVDKDWIKIYADEKISTWVAKDVNKNRFLVKVSGYPNRAFKPAPSKTQTATKIKKIVEDCENECESIVSDKIADLICKSPTMLNNESYSLLVDGSEEYKFSNVQGDEVSVSISEMLDENSHVKSIGSCTARNKVLSILEVLERMDIN